MRHLITVTLGLAAVVGSASAQTFIATRGTTLYRTNGAGGVVNTFTLSDEIIGMARTSDGTVYGVSQIQNPGEVSKLYRIDDIEGTPTLTEIPSTLSRLYTSLTTVGDDLYAFRAGGPTSTVGRMVQIDTSTGAETEIATFNTFRGSGGAAYSADSDTMWILGDTPNTLYSIDDYTPAVFGELALTSIGLTGLDAPSVGMEFFQGALYAVALDTNSGDMTLGRLNQNTGAFSRIRDLDFGITEGAATALLVIPSPSTFGLGLLGLGLASTRRRR